MERNKLRTLRRSRRKTGIRKRLLGTAERPRLSVYRSGKHVYVQVVDDLEGKTLASASSVQAKMSYGGNVESAKQVGTKIAEAAKAAGVEQVAFDRNGFRYHGRVKALADAAREAGLKF
ncbi:MAG: 50S ribosomal protein L18 [Planctomycetota bacterium]